MEVRENEFVKALEWCDRFENNVVVMGNGDERCSQALQMMVVIKHALREYHRQAAEKKELEFEFIRSRNERKAWKIRAEAYEEKCSKLQRKNSELGIDLQEMRDAENSYKAEIERLQKANESFSCLGMLYSEIKSEARKEFAERLCEGRVSNDPVVIAAKVELSELTERKEDEK